MNDLFIFLGAVSVFVITLSTSISTQIDNYNNKDYRKIVMFVVTLCLSMVTVFFLKYTNLGDMQMLKDFTNIDIIFCGIMLGMISTGFYDITKKGFKNE